MGESSSRRSRELGGESSLVGRPDFKSGKGCQTVLGGFDSRSLPPLALFATRFLPVLDGLAAGVWQPVARGNHAGRMA